MDEEALTDHIHLQKTLNTFGDFITPSSVASSSVKRWGNLEGSFIFICGYNNVKICKNKNLSCL